MSVSDDEYTEKIAMAIYAASTPWSMMTVTDAKKYAELAVSIINPDAIRKDERKRAGEIVRNWAIKSNYIVGKMRIEDRKEKIATAIEGDNDETI